MDQIDPTKSSLCTLGKSRPLHPRGHFVTRGSRSGRVIPTGLANPRPASYFYEHVVFTFVDGAADMDVYFKTKKMQKACVSMNRMIAEFGEKRAKKLGQRLTELDAAENLDQMSRLPPARCHELTGNLKGVLSLDLDHPYRLLILPANDPVPRKPDGGLDWSMVTAVQVVDIVDTH